jgi:hypothetical protein
MERKRKQSKTKDYVAFEDTVEGKDYELFRVKWYSLPFGSEAGEIDTKKLWWQLLSWSEQGNTYKNWMSAARTFYLNSPNQYQANNGTRANTKAIEFGNSNHNVAEFRGEEYFIPEHLRNDERSNK